MVFMCTQFICACFLALFKLYFEKVKRKTLKQKAEDEKRHTIVEMTSMSGNTIEDKEYVVQIETLEELIKKNRAEDEEERHLSLEITSLSGNTVEDNCGSKIVEEKAEDDKKKHIPEELTSKSGDTSEHKESVVRKASCTEDNAVKDSKGNNCQKIRGCVEDENKGFNSSGLPNLGNTCYLNAAVQVLHSVPELKQMLLSFQDEKGRDNPLTMATKELVAQLGRSHNRADPTNLLQAIRAKYPKFAEISHGAYIQQDADECITKLLETFSNTFPEASVGDLFGIHLTSRSRSNESTEELEQPQFLMSLKCRITTNVCDLFEGVKLDLNSQVEKFSKVLDKIVIFQEEWRLTHLPRYLKIDIVRFEWSIERKFSQKKLQRVRCPIVLDIHDICSADVVQEASILTYELMAILVHTGISASSGHYTAWVKEKDNWVEYDDGLAILHEEDDVLQLLQGEEGVTTPTTPYVCLYKAKF